MKKLHNRNETIQFSILNSPMMLSNSQLFFLENYLRKQPRSIITFHKTNNTNGIFTIEISRLASNEKFEILLKKIVMYLLIFQGIYPSTLSAKLVRISKIPNEKDPIGMNLPLKQHSFQKK